ncbi:hypothetical protein [Streptomyces flavofungini]|uniref:hypothetical protein n=1 Tax=Streptomyces flavofungini TaxID=68200 RepID=UPI0025AF0F25|nr:hypothetical protein [Streptomyces flavofungini]WJV45688.1 hypothetical protein QUY26_09165 [Streptomyces flavofungini]
MREKPGTGGEPKQATEGEQEKKRFDLSVPQVAGSAVAAVVAAKLASSFGVYGTILGAGVVSGIATCGGTVFQHFFSRTGEQIRDVAVQAKPKAQQVPVTRATPVPETFQARAHTGGGPVTTTWGRSVPDADPTTALPAVDPADSTAALPAVDPADPTTALPVAGTDPERTQLLGSVDAMQFLPHDQETRVLRQAGPDGHAIPVGPVGPAGPAGPVPPHGPAPADPAVPSDEFSEGTTHRTRVRSWKRPLVAAALVFGVSLAGITTYELVSGKSFSGDDKSTTIRDALSNSGSSSKKDDPPSTGDPGQQSDDDTSGPDDGSKQDDGTSKDPSDKPSPGDGTGSGSGSGNGSGTDKGDETGNGNGTDKGDSGSGDGSKPDPKPTPTPTPKPTPTPSNGGGTGNGSGDVQEQQQVPEQQ